MKCPDCGYVMGEFDLNCKRCEQMEKSAKEKSESQPTQKSSTVSSNVQEIPQQPISGTIVQVQQSNNGNTAWWILALIFAGPIGCLLLPAILFGGAFIMVFASYCAPLIIAGGISWWIWAKHPGKREERVKYIWITMVIGFVGTLLWIGIVLAAGSTTPATTACLLSSITTV